MITLKNTFFCLEIFEDCGFTISQIYYKNKPILHFPYAEKEYKENQELAGIPFLYPFANRLSEKEFLLENKPIRIAKEDSFFDANNIPLHGYLLKTSFWNINFKTDEMVMASITFDFSSKLYQMFSFLHKLEYKIELNNNQIHFFITIKPQEKTPISFGFHPYFLLYGDKSHTQVILPAKSHIKTNDFLIPMGQLTPIEEFFRNKSIDFLSLQEGYAFTLDYFFDDGFTNFIHQNQYNRIRLMQKEYNISLFMDPYYKVCQIYSPIDSNFVCIEPMISQTNAFISKIYNVITREQTFHFFIEMI